MIILNSGRFTFRSVCLLLLVFSSSDLWLSRPVARSAYILPSAYTHVHHRLPKDIICFPCFEINFVSFNRFSKSEPKAE